MGKQEVDNIFSRKAEKQRRLYMERKVLMYSGWRNRLEEMEWLSVAQGTSWKKHHEERGRCEMGWIGWMGGKEYGCSNRPQCSHL